MTTAYLHLAGNKLLISFDYNKYLISQIKKIPGTRWNKNLSRWEAPLSLYGRLVSSLDDVKISKAVMRRLQEEANAVKAVEDLRKKDYHELVDYAPKVPLMSHQKKAFELHRMLKGSGNFSEMGAGKCLLPDALVNINSTLQKIETVWNENTDHIEMEDPSGGFWSHPITELNIISLNSEGELIKKQVKRLFRQKIKEKLKKVHLDDGSYITITQAHKLYQVDNWTNTFEVGQRICVPRKLPHESGELDPKLSELMGWMIGDGCDSEGHSSKNSHEFTQKEDRSRNHVSDLFRYVAASEGIELNIREKFPEDRTPFLVVCNVDFADFFRSKGYKWGHKSATKEVPNTVMKANKEAVVAFLRGYFDAEAWVNNEKNQIEISSASELLIKQINTLLRRFGIWLRVKKKKKCATNGSGIYRDYWVGTIGGEASRIYAREIGFFTDYKHNDLQKFLDVKSNSNVEGLPACAILQEILEKTGLPKRHIVGSYTVYLRGTQEPSRKTLQVFIDNIDKILSGQKMLEMISVVRRGGPGSTRCKQYWTAYHSLDKDWLREKRNKLQQLINQEVHYVKITSIEEIDYDGWVYDLEVEETHNYIAENILCHNTASAICSIHWHLEKGDIDKTLIICPKSVIRGWEEQIEFFSDLTYVSITGIKKEDRLKKLKLKRNIYLINYEYTWRIIDLLLEMNFEMVIAHEAHRIKNPQSNQSKACYKLADKAEYKIALTGTPVLNSSLDAFGVMRFIDSTVFGESYYSFRSRFFKNVGPENSPIQIYIPKHGADQEISDKMYTKALRFLKEECMDLPIATHLPDRVIYLSRDQDKAYRNLQEQLSAQITENKSIKINHVLSLMLKLNQITSGWVKDTDTGEIIHFKSNPKFDELKNIVEEAGEQPIILWAYYTADMKLLTDFYGRCRKCKVPVNNINKDKCPSCHTPIKYRCSEVQGSTKYRNAEIAKFRLTTKERSEQRKKFIEEGMTPAEIRYELGDLLPDGSEPPQTNIICCQCVAASEGLNLQRATMAVFYSRNWSLKDWTQALARNHRKGQTKRVTYINLVAKMLNGDDTVDQRIVNALTAKEDLSKRVNKDDIKLLTGGFSKKDRERLQDIDIDNKNDEKWVDPENEFKDGDASPEQGNLF
jgi:intein/homing endonuclease